MYVANVAAAGTPGGNDVSAYTINASTGVLTPVTGSPFATGVSPFSVTTDPSGKFLYVANGDSGTVSAFVIDATTGALAPAANSPFAAGHNASSIAVSK